MVKVTKQRSKVLKRKKDAGGSLLDRIVPIEEAGGAKGIKLALYGRSGSGKTTFACTFPKKLLLIRVGTDDGVLSVSNVRGVHVTPTLNDPDELDVIIKDQQKTNRWNTVVLDNASEYQNIMLAKVVGLDSAPTQLSWNIARQQQWGDVAVGMKDKLRSLLGLADNGTNVVIIAQERSFDEDDSEILNPNVAEALSPSVVGWLNPACDYVFQTFIRPEMKLVKKKLGKKIKEKRVQTGEYEYCLRTSIHSTYTVKFRKPKGVQIPECLVDPSYEQFEKLRKLVAKKGD